MRTETRTVRIGENVGPVPADYNYEEDSPRVERFKALVDATARGEEWEATTDGGWPRVGWGRVLEIGMYDGWPYWTPTPSVYIASWMGGSWNSWRMVCEARPVSRGVVVSVASLPATHLPSRGTA